MLRVAECYLAILLRNARSIRADQIIHVHCLDVVEMTARLLQLLAILIALLLHLLPGVVQQNQPWLLFALPCWLALAWTLRRTP